MRAFWSVTLFLYSVKTRASDTLCSKPEHATVAPMKIAVIVMIKLREKSMAPPPFCLTINTWNPHFQDTKNMRCRLLGCFYDYFLKLSNIIVGYVHNLWLLTEKAYYTFYGFFCSGAYDSEKYLIYLSKILRTNDFCFFY